MERVYELLREWWYELEQKERGGRGNERVSSASTKRQRLPKHST